MACNGIEFFYTGHNLSIEAAATLDLQCAALAVSSCGSTVAGFHVCGDHATRPAPACAPRKG